MHINVSGKTIIAVVLFLATCITVSSLEPACAAKPGGNDGNVVWKGSTKTKDGTATAVKLTIGPGQKSVVMEYRSPRSCTLQAEQIDDNKFSFKSSDGGYCDNLLLGTLETKKNGNTMNITVTPYKTKDPKYSEVGTLYKEQPN